MRQGCEIGKPPVQDSQAKAMGDSRSSFVTRCVSRILDSTNSATRVVGATADLRNRCHQSLEVERFSGKGSDEAGNREFGSNFLTRRCLRLN
jgi:hypothetical protein